MSLPTGYPKTYYPNANIVTLDPAQAQAITSAFTQVTGLAATSTSAFVAVPGSQLQTSFNEIISYQVTVAAHDVKAQIYGSINGVNFTAIGSPTTITSGTTALVSVANGGYLYYNLYIEDNVGGTHGTITAVGFCI